MSIAAYGYGIRPLGGTSIIELGEVEITTADVVVSLVPDRIINLPAVLSVVLDPDLSVTVDQE